MPTLLIEHPVGVTCGHYRHILLLPGREAITVCGNRCLPAQLALDSLCEGLRWPRITVHDEEPFRRAGGGGGGGGGGGRGGGGRGGGGRVGEAKLEVVEHAPPRGHPAG